MIRLMIKKDSTATEEGTASATTADQMPRCSAPSRSAHCS